MSFNWSDLKIQAGSRSGGNVKTTCPNCSSERKNKHDKCLSVNLDNGTYFCHHCGWAGKAEDSLRKFYQQSTMQQKKVYAKPKYTPGENPEDQTVAWFQNRGISEAIVRRHRIEVRSVCIDGPQPERAIAFPYIRGGEIVNVQYRTRDKRFRLEKGAELILYGIDDIQEGEPLIIVEGQMDKLSLEEAGYPNCVSVPNGANLRDSEWLSSAQEQLDKAKYFILAGDNDEPGRKLMDELSRRLDPAKCWRVSWPEGCKDANEVLTKKGKAEIITAIECATPLPIQGIVEMTDLLPDLHDLYKTGVQPGEHPGWEGFAKLYRPRAGEFTMITGAPGMGKSSFLDAMMMNLALGAGWKFALFSPEQAPLKRHASQLLELWSGQPFSPGPTQRMSWGQALDGIEVLTDYFKFLPQDDGDITIDGILDRIKACVIRYGIRAFVIDPWNEIEHNCPASMTETQYISKSLSTIRRFARLYDLHAFVLVHPTKLQKKPDGSYPVAAPYDAAGSAHWFNKADMILSVWRDKARQDSPLEVHVQKVRFRENGDLGCALLRYDRVTGRLVDLDAAPSESNYGYDYQEQDAN